MRNYKALINLKIGRRAAAVLAGLLFAGHVAAQDPPVINPDVALEYTVKKGDTLWDISEYFLRDPWLWPELWSANPQVANPHLIYPGEILYLVWIDGRPRLTRKPPARNEVVRLSPRARTLSLGAPIPTIPLDAIRAFLNGPRVVEEEVLETAPYIVAFGDERLLGSSEADSYIKGSREDDGYRYSVVRKGQRYTDPETGRTLGYEAIPVAQADVQQFGDISHAVLSQSLREVRIEDSLLPASSLNFDPNFYPHAPEKPIQGQIIAVFDGVSQIGQYQIVTLNRGQTHGLENGHVLRVKQRGITVRDPKKFFRSSLRLPEVDAGYLMVFMTYKDISYGLVMRASRPIHILDKVTHPDSEA